MIWNKYYMKNDSENTNTNITTINTNTNIHKYNTNKNICL